MRKEGWNLNKSQRMQLKALVCILGILLLVILLVGRTLTFLFKDREEEEVHIPVVTQLENVWIMEVTDNGLMVYQDGQEQQYPFGYLSDEESKDTIQTLYQVPKESREQVADITLTDGSVTDVRVKATKVNGKVLSAGKDAIELEGVGRIPLSANARGYRLYDNLSMCSAADVMVGYNFNDFVMENGEICAILMVKEEAMEYIRVMLKTADYGGRFHENITVTADTEYTIRYGSYDNMAEELHGAGEECNITPDSAYFQSDRIYIVPKVLTGKITLKNVNRSQGAPSYRGTIELMKTSDGIVAVNEVLLEEYLYSVVPSEMPASYPEEALKAQAVCARTYAYSHMLKAGYSQYGAHVDDSASYQVYNNILEQESTTTAAKGTYGQLLYTPDGTSLAGAYYYSTSCGLGSDASVWKGGSTEGLGYLKPRSINSAVMKAYLQMNDAVEAGSTGASLPEAMKDIDMIGQAMMEEQAFAEFIQTKNADDFEVSEGWYRWTYTVPELNRDHMLEAIRKRYDANEKYVLTRNSDGEFVSEPVTELGEIRGLTVVKRGSGGVAEELLIETDKNAVKVITEHNIRYVLNDGTSKIFRQDGSEVASPNLLPSAFFILTPSVEKDKVTGYTLTGGGFGHGVGMSQNGARNMAKAGFNAEDILKFFYEGCFLQQAYQSADIQGTQQ